MIFVCGIEGRYITLRCAGITVGWAREEGREEEEEEEGTDKSVFRNPLPQCSSLETSLRGIARGEGREGKIPSKSEGLSHPHPHTIRGGNQASVRERGGFGV